MTLTGPAGSGKTRLALETARREADWFADGARMVELDSVADPALVPVAVAAALGVVERAAEPTVQTVARTLGSKRLLLVLDNCEHLIEACAELCADLLGACAGLHVVATSREVLGLQGEHALAVPPLAPPPDGADLASPRFPHRLRSEIQRRFGGEVLRIVKPVPIRMKNRNQTGRFVRSNTSKHCATRTDSAAALVAIADKLHNARSMLADYRKDGDTIWSRFNAPRDKQVWYLRSVAEAVGDRVPRAMLAELEEIVERLEGPSSKLQQHESASSGRLP